MQQGWSEVGGEEKLFIVVCMNGLRCERERNREKERESCRRIMQRGAYESERERQRQQTLTEDRAAEQIGEIANEDGCMLRPRQLNEAKESSKRI